MEERLPLLFLLSSFSLLSPLFAEVVRRRCRCDRSPLLPDDRPDLRRSFFFFPVLARKGRR